MSAPAVMANLGSDEAALFQGADVYQLVNAGGGSTLQALESALAAQPPTSPPLSTAAPANAVGTPLQDASLYQLMSVEGAQAIQVLGGALLGIGQSVDVQA
ncbi:MAG: hypothetical protein M1370_01555 [Bacteroidetes bacterium]|nr:hypothetical protein [Bacteroidota bacterium]MCL5025152.1 hypothetical protein [Chloroflexota bacterium]